MTRDILKCSAKAVVFLVLTIALIVAEINIGKLIHTYGTGEIREEEFLVLDEINEKILNGQYPLQELTENFIEVSLSKDKVNNWYNLELKASSTSENIYLDDEANVINIEKHDNTLETIVSIIFFFLIGLISLLSFGYCFIKNILNLIAEIKWHIDEIKWHKEMKKEEQQDIEE